MLEAPRQVWETYEKRCREACVDRLRSLSPAAAFAAYAHLCHFACAVAGSLGDRDRLGTTRWREKLALRRKLHAAFVALDRIRDQSDG